MIEQIEKKIEAYIAAILTQDNIDFTDYQVLVSEVSRLTAKEKEAKLAAENKAQQAQWLETLTNMVSTKNF